MNKDIITLIKDETGFPEEHITIKPIPPDGSHRMFWRVSSKEGEFSFVVMYNPPKTSYDLRENRAYFMIGRHLKNKGISVPSICAAEPEKGLFIMEDLGDTHLQEKVFSLEKDKNTIYEIYEHTFEELLRFQVDGIKGFDTKWCCETKSYDRYVMIEKEAFYFRDVFLKKFTGISKGLEELYSAFDFIVEQASKADTDFLLHRDFQSRNILLSEKGVNIIDWQGARMGPLAYDAASLIIDPYVNIAYQERESLYDKYKTLLKGYNENWCDLFEWTYPYLALLRNLQILGAFSYLVLVAGKKKFEQYIPLAVLSLKCLLDNVNDPRLVPIKSIMEDIEIP